MWSDYESQVLFREIADGFNGKFPDTEWEHWARSLGKYHFVTVQTAIRQVREQSDTRTRPGLGRLLRMCGRIVGEKRQGKVKSDCAWCEGKWLLRAHVWTVPVIDADALQIPAKMRRDGQQLTVVDPRIATQVGAVRRDLVLLCGHCGSAPGVMTVKEASDRFGSFVCCEWSNDSELYGRCVSDDEPGPLVRVALRESGISPEQLRQALEAT